MESDKNQSSRKQERNWKREADKPLSLVVPLREIYKKYDYLYECSNKILIFRLFVSRDREKVWTGNIRNYKCSEILYQI